MGTLSSVIAATPTYEITLPSTGKKIEYRPFLVKEEKILLMASESKNESEIRRAMHDVVSACTFGKLDMENCPMIDIEYLFLKIRTKSVGETAKPVIKCPKCNKGNETVIDISNIEPIKKPNHSTKINLTKDVIVEMRYPQYRDIEEMNKKTVDSDKMFRLLGLCIDKVYTPSGTFVGKDLTEEDLNDFMDRLTQAQFKGLSDFFETMPQIQKTIQYTCSCGNNEEITLRGMQDFF